MQVTCSQVYPNLRLFDQKEKKKAEIMLIDRQTDCKDSKPRPDPTVKSIEVTKDAKVITVRLIPIVTMTMHTML